MLSLTSCELTTKRPLIWTPIRSLSQWPTSSRLTLLVDFTRKQRKNAWSWSTFPRLSIGFVTKPFWRKLLAFGFSLVLARWTSSFLSKLTISIQVDGVLFQWFIEGSVSRGVVLAPTLFLLFTVDLYTIANPNHSFANGVTLHCPLSYHTSPRKRQHRSSPLCCPCIFKL